MGLIDEFVRARALDCINGQSGSMSMLCQETQTKRPRPKPPEAWEERLVQLLYAIQDEHNDLAEVLSQAGFDPSVVCNDIETALARGKK